MDPADQFAMEGMDPANWFAMEGLNMAFVAELVADGKPLAKGLFLDIMTKKPQMLVDHIKHLHLALALVVNIGENVATVKVYDNYAEDSLKLHATLSNVWDIEDQLYRLWIEVNGVI